MDLYALPPEEFTAARDAAARQAKKDGDRERAKELAALRRPSLSAHTVNALVRAEPDLLGQLLDLGAELAQAQSTGQGAALRALGEQRRALVEAVADRAALAAGRALGPTVRAEVVATLEAALADPSSAEAVRSGHLVRALSYAGFGGVDLDGAVAALPDGPREPRKAPAKRQTAGRGAAPENAAQERAAQEAQEQAAQEAQERAAQEAQERAAQERRTALAAAERAALEAAGVLDDAVRAHSDAAERERAAAARRDHAADAVHAAEAALRQAREDEVAAVDAERLAGLEVGSAAEEVTAAQGAAERARAVLERLRRG